MIKMSVVEVLSNLVWTIELSIRQFFSVVANLVDYQSLINFGELVVVCFGVGIISRIGVKPKETETIIKIEKTIKE